MDSTNPYLKVPEAVQADSAVQVATADSSKYSFKWYDVHAGIFILLWIIALTANLPFYNLKWNTLSPRYVLHKVPVHRHRDPLRMIVNGAHLPNKLKIAMDTDLKDFNLKSKKQVREYIETLNHPLGSQAFGHGCRRPEKLSAAIARYLNDPKKGISVPLRCYLRSAFPMLVHEERAGPCLVCILYSVICLRCNGVIVPTQNPALSNHRYSDRPMFRSVSRS